MNRETERIFRGYDEYLEKNGDAESMDSVDDINSSLIIYL